MWREDGRGREWEERESKKQMYPLLLSYFTQENS